MPTMRQKKDLRITGQPSDSAVSGLDEKKRQRRHKHKSKRKQLEKVTAPPPLRPRSRPASQQSGTRSEAASGGGGVAELGEALNATKLNEKQDAQIVEVPADTKEKMASDSANNSTSQGNIVHNNENEQVTNTEETTATVDDKIHIADGDEGNINSNSTNNYEETEATV